MILDVIDFEQEKKSAYLFTTRVQESFKIGYQVFYEKGIAFKLPIFSLSIPR